MPRNTNGASQGAPFALMRRVVVSVAVAYGVSMLLLAAYLRLCGDVTSMGMILVFAPRWLFVLPWAPLAVASCFFSFPVAAGTLIAALLTAISVANFEIPLGGAGPVTARALRVVTYNTDGSRTLPARIRDDMRLWNADVAVFQACLDPLADSLRAAGVGTVRTLGEFCAISKLPLDGFDALYDPLASGHPLAVRLRVQTPRGPVLVYSVHLSSPRDALWSSLHFDDDKLAGSVRRRTLQSRSVADWVRASRLPSVVVGDFNVPTGSAILKNDWSEFEDAFAARGWGYGYTMRAGKFAVRIDHVLLSAPFATDRVMIYRGYPSEHQPLLADVAWRR